MEYDEMNEEEIQKEVVKAENRYEDLKDRVHYQYEEIQQLKKKYEIMKENAETLAKRINKAIEYINNADNITIVHTIYNDSVGDINRKMLLNILKGEDK